MEMPSLNSSSQFERRIDIGKLDMSKVDQYLPYGGIDFETVSNRNDGLKIGNVINDFEKITTKLNSANINSLLHVVLARTNALKQSYESVENISRFMSKGQTRHDVDRAVAALDHQSECIREVMSALSVAGRNGKSPAQALDAMSTAMFEKSSRSDQWLGGKRMSTNNPLRAINSLTRPSEHRIVKKFLEVLVDNVCTVDARVARMVPVLDYGLAKHREELKKHSKRSIFNHAPKASASAIEKPEPVVEMKLSDIAQRNLDSNARHLDGYLKGLAVYYSKELISGRKQIFHEDIFQITKGRIEAVAAKKEISQEELRELFKRSITNGLDAFHERFGVRVSEDTLQELLDRTEKDVLDIVKIPAAPKPTLATVGMLKAYARAVSS